jgi:hypothetical protein
MRILTRSPESQLAFQEKGKKEAGREDKGDYEESKEFNSDSSLRRPANHFQETKWSANLAIGRGVVYTGEY